MESVNKIYEGDILKNSHIKYLLHNLCLTQFPFSISFQISRFIRIRFHHHRAPEGNSGQIYFLLRTMSQNEICKGVRIGSVHMNRS